MILSSLKEKSLQREFFKLYFHKLKKVLYKYLTSKLSVYLYIHLLVFAIQTKNVVTGTSNVYYC